MLWIALDTVEEMQLASWNAWTRVMRLAEGTGPLNITRKISLERRNQLDRNWEKLLHWFLICDEGFLVNEFLARKLFWSDGSSGFDYLGLSKRLQVDTDYLCSQNWKKKSDWGRQKRDYLKISVDKKTHSSKCAKAWRIYLDIKLVSVRQKSFIVRTDSWVVMAVSP